MTADLIDALLADHARRLPRLQRLWEYYRNPLTFDVAGSTVRAKSAQRRGLPDRLQSAGDEDAAGPVSRSPREQVIENDIAWRLHTQVDFMFGRPVTIQSLAPDPERATHIEMFLRSVFEQNGGISFFQDLGLLGAIYGFVDVLVRTPTTLKAVQSNVKGRIPIHLDLIEPLRAVPLISEADYRRLDAYLIHFQQRIGDPMPHPFLARVRAAVRGGSFSRPVVAHTHVWTADHYAIYRSRDGKRQLVETGVNPVGELPVVHMQNLPQPFFYEGLSEVEPLIPLQNELNTRLSDRANRVTFQSFKMYLGKGIDGFDARPVGPGQMWATDNLDASIQEFGGDAVSPSETEHITEIREAMDKISGVTPLAAGVLRDKIGNLTSENALRITMLGLLAKTVKKRVAYGDGIQRLCRLILAAADRTGVLHSSPDERDVRLDWPDPLPASETQQLENARTKLDIGVPRKRVLVELGYDDVEPESS